MKTKIFKNWATTILGLLIALIGTDAYFQIFGKIKDINLISYISISAFALIIMLSSHKGLLEFLKDVFSKRK